MAKVSDDRAPSHAIGAGVSGVVSATHKTLSNSSIIANIISLRGAAIRIRFLVKRPARFLPRLPEEVKPVLQAPKRDLKEYEVQ
jgi:hypothetical protein